MLLAETIMQTNLENKVLNKFWLICLALSDFHFEIFTFSDIESILCRIFILYFHDMSFLHRTFSELLRFWAKASVACHVSKVNLRFFDVKT